MELIYLFKVTPSVAQAVAAELGLEKAPSHVRVATLAPLSNYGYTDDAEAGLLGVRRRGIVIGAANDPKVPRAFVPWQNIAYLADGSKLA